MKQRTQQKCYLL